MTIHTYDVDHFLLMIIALLHNNNDRVSSIFRQPKLLPLTKRIDVSSPVYPLGSLPSFKGARLFNINKKRCFFPDLT